MDRIPQHLLESPSELVNDLTSFINSMGSEYIVQFSQATAHVILSHLYGRQYKTETGLPTNLYSMLVAQSGIGKNYCKHACNEFGDLNSNVLGGATSDSAIHTALYRNPNLLLSTDEIGDSLDSKSNNGKSFLRMLRDAYNTNKLLEKGYSGRVNGKIESKTDNYTIINPALSLIGFTTPGQLCENLGEGDIESGTLNRFNIVNAEVNEIELNDGEILTELPTELIRKILLSGSNLLAESNGLSRIKPDIELIKYTKGDKLRLAKIRRELLSSPNSAYTVRMVENAARLALVITVSLGLKVIPTSVLNWCLEYTEYWSYNIKNISNSVNQTQYAKDMKKFLNKIKNYKEGLEQYKINKYFTQTLGYSQRERTEMLDHLIADKLIECVESAPNPKNGKTKKLWLYNHFNNK